MNPSDAINQAKTKASAALNHFSATLKGLRTGRASASLLDPVTVEVYGTNLPLIQVASITVPEAQLLQVTPFDPSNLAAISNAIRNNQTLGLNPADDGRVVRVPIPPLTEARRRDLAKQVYARQEESLISLRNIRHEAIDLVDQAKKDKQIGEDEAKRLASQIEEVITKTRSQIETAAKAKEQEILTL